MENWKEIKGYEGLYEVSSDGRFRNIRTGKILKLSESRNYLQVALYKDGLKSVYYAHVVVKNTFDTNPDPEHLTQINHINEIKTDNRVENLEFCTPKYNSNYGSHVQKMFNTNIKNGLWNPERCGIDIKERLRKYYQENKEKWKEYKRKRLGN